MAKQKVYLVNFGSGNSGLSTVGYTLYNKDATSYQARTTSGVVEYGTSTGVYGAEITLPEDKEIVVVWDTGGASPRYATEENRIQIDAIQEQTVRINNIWNSLKNQGDFLAVLMEKMGLLEKNEGLKLIDVKQTIDNAVGGIKFPEIPKTEIPPYPDNTGNFTKIEKMIYDLKNDVKSIPRDYPEIRGGLRKAITGIDAIPKTQKEYAGNFKNLEAYLDKLQNVLSEKLQEKANTLSDQIETIKMLFSKVDALLVKISEFNDKLSSLDGNNKQLMKERRTLLDEIKRTDVLIKAIAEKEKIFSIPKEQLGMAFSHLIK